MEGSPLKVLGNQPADDCSYQPKRDAANATATASAHDHVGGKARD